MMMWQLALLLNKKISTKLDSTKAKYPDQGFITLEILISMLVAFGFIILSLQTVVSGLAFKVLAQKEFGGDRLIQEEIERLNDLARVENLSLTFMTEDACNGVLDLDGDSALDDGHGQALWNLRTSGTATIAVLPVTDVITVTPSITTNNNLVGRALTLTGTRNTADPGGVGIADAHKILGINYVVTGPDEDGDGAPDEIATRYVEVIPDEALECS